MRKMLLAAVSMLGISLLLGGVVIGVAYWRGSISYEPPQENFDTSRLTTGDIVGNWKRVALPEDAERPDGFRQLSASGKLITRYGDEVHHGTYKIHDRRTMETTHKYHGQTDKVYRWTYGFMDGKLIMINETTGWVEAYERVQVAEFLWL